MEGACTTLVDVCVVAIVINFWQAVGLPSLERCSGARCDSGSEKPIAGAGLGFYVRNARASGVRTGLCILTALGIEAFTYSGGVKI